MTQRVSGQSPANQTSMPVARTVRFDRTPLLVFNTAYRVSRFSSWVFTCFSWSNTAPGVVPKKAKPALTDQ